MLYLLSSTLSNSSLTLGSFFAIFGERWHFAADKELVSRLDNELKHEEEQAGSDPAVPEFLAEFNKDGLWTVSLTLEFVI